MEYPVRTLTIRFENKIETWEVPAFRGAVLSKVPRDLVLFHNHTGDDTFRYGYPLIQYKRLSSKAAIVCIGDGVDLIADYFRKFERTFVNIGERAIFLEIGEISLQDTVIQVNPGKFVYCIENWLGFNQENIRAFYQEPNFLRKYQMIQKTLTANIISFAKGLGIFVKDRIEVEVLEMSDAYNSSFKGVKMTTFDMVFACNVSLPNHIGLGKGVSKGFGTITKIQQ